MRKFGVFLCSLVLVLGLAGGASAIIIHEETLDLGVTLAEGPIAGLFYEDEYTYSHKTPIDFEVPFDTVTSASLTISGYYINGNNDTVSVDNKSVGTLEAGGVWLWFWDDPSVSVFNIAPTFANWSTGASLDIIITANGGCLDGVLYLSSSKFILEYENGTAPVPEPATMLLLGTGLMGLAAANRKRLLKKN